MTTSVTNKRYENIAEAALIFFTILVGLKLADLIDTKSGTLGADQWPCFIMGVAFFLRYVTGSYNHQRAQNVNRLEEHDFQFLLDIGFLIAFGIIAVWACEADTVEAFLNRLLVFTATALAWTVVYLAFELRAKAREFTYFPWLLVNVVQIEVLWIAKVLWPPSSPPSPTISVLCFEFPWLWILSGASILLLYADLWFQLGFHRRSPASSRAAIR